MRILLYTGLPMIAFNNAAKIGAVALPAPEVDPDDDGDGALGRRDDDSDAEEIWPTSTVETGADPSRRKDGKDGATNRRIAFAWWLTGPFVMFVILRMCIDPLCELMPHQIEASCDAWETQQAVGVAYAWEHGFEAKPQYMIGVAANNLYEKACIDKCLQLLTTTGLWQALPL